MSAPDERNTFPNTLKTPVTPHEERSVADLASTARDDLASLGDDVKQQAQAIGDEAKTQVGELVDDVAEKAKGLAADQKNMIVSHLEGVASAMDLVATELEEDGEPTARYARMVADGADKLLANVADRDINDLMAMTQDFGRRQPVAFLGAAALVGFAASRFVLASSARRSNSAPNLGTPGSSSGLSRGTGPSSVPQTVAATPHANPYGTSRQGGSNGAI